MFREGAGLKETVAAGVLVQLSILLVLSSVKSRVVLEMFTAVIIYVCGYIIYMYIYISGYICIYIHTYILYIYLYIRNSYSLALISSAVQADFESYFSLPSVGIPVMCYHVQLFTSFSVIIGWF